MNTIHKPGMAQNTQKYRGRIGRISQNLICGWMQLNKIGYFKLNIMKKTIYLYITARMHKNIINKNSTKVATKHIHIFRYTHIHL